MKKNLKLKKILNFRSLFFILILGLFCIFFAYQATNSLLYLISFIVPILFLLYLLVKKKYVLLSFTSVFLIFISCFTFVSITNYNDNNYNQTSVTIVAKIDNIISINDDFYYFNLSNISIVDNDNTKSLKGNATMGVYTNEEGQTFKLHQKIVLSSKLSSVDIKNNLGELDSYYLNENIKYSVKSVSVENITFVQDDSNIIEKLQDYNRNLLIQNFGETKGNLAYTVLYGDKNYTESSILDQFKTAGIVHLLSVSGLHVGLIVLLLNLLLNKSKLKEYIKFIINFIFLLIFCILTSFTSSVLRASIMTLVVLLSKLFYKKYDILNSVSFTGIILMFFNPFYIFNVGFQLSFSSVFGIILFSSIFKFIKLNKISQKILSPIVTTVGAELFILPILANTYGYVATWSILFNLLVIPIFSLFYTILFVTNLLVLIAPFLSFLYFISKSLLDVVLFAVRLTDVLPANLIFVPTFNLYASSIYYVALFILSKYVVIKPLSKGIVSAVLISLVCLIVTFSCLPKFSKQNDLTFYESSSSLGTLYASKNNKFYLINPDLTKSKEIATELNTLKIYDLSGIIICFEQDFESNLVDNNLSKFSPTYYLPQGSSHYNSLQSLGASVVCDNSEKIIFDNYFSLKYFYHNSSAFAVSLEIQTFNVVFFNGILELNTSLKNFVQTTFNYLLDCAKIIKSDYNDDWNTIISSKETYFESSTSYSLLAI